MQAISIFIPLYCQSLTGPDNESQILSYAKEGLILISFPSVFRDKPEELNLCIAREYDPQGGGSREEWERTKKEREKVKLWSKSTTIDYGDGRGEEIHFLWVSRPPRSE